MTAPSLSLMKGRVVKISSEELRTSQDLIADFKTGHQAIIEAIDSIQASMRTYREVKPRIRTMQRILLDHFGREGNEFYERLRTFYTSDRHATKMIEFLTYDLKDVKIKFLTFFDKYSGEMGDAGSRNFPRDFMDFISHIIARIKVEEDQLLPLLAKLQD